MCQVQLSAFVAMELTVSMRCVQWHYLYWQTALMIGIITYYLLILSQREILLIAVLYLNNCTEKEMVNLIKFLFVGKEIF